MKKVALSLSILLVAGCNSQPTQPETQTPTQVNSEYQEMAAAIAAGQSVRCLMTDTAKNLSMTYLMKDKKVKMTNMQTGETDQTGAMLMDGEYLYTWSEQKKEGTKMLIPDETTTQSTQTQEVPDLADEAERNQYEEMGYTIDCNVEAIADSEFTPPTDVRFVDMSAMMKDMEAAGTQQGMTPEQQKQMEEMMKQYGQ